MPLIILDMYWYLKHCLPHSRLAAGIRRHFSFWKSTCLFFQVCVFDISWQYVAILFQVFGIFWSTYVHIVHFVHTVQSVHAVPYRVLPITIALAIQWQSNINQYISPSVSIRVYVYMYVAVFDNWSVVQIHRFARMEKQIIQCPYTKPPQNHTWLVCNQRHILWAATQGEHSWACCGTI